MNERLCIVSPNLGAYSETFIKDQANYLEAGTILYHGNYPVKSTANDWKLPFPMNIQVIRGAVRKFLPSLFHRIYTNALTAYLKNHKIEIVLANYGPVGVSVADACEKAGVKLVVHFHGFDAYAYETLDQFKEAYKRMFRKADRIIAVSTEMNAQLIALGADPEKIAFIPYGINLEKFSSTNPALNEPLLVNIGRFTAKKAPDLLIKAFKKVHDAIPEARLVMVGGGELFDSSKALAASLNLSDFINFAGVKSSEEIISLLHQGRMYVQHSLRPATGDSEGTPVSILEACACGLPVVSTRHAGIKDAVIEHKNGLLVDEGDWEAMGDAIISLIRNPELCRQMGEASREHIAASYNFPVQVKKLETQLLNK